jgi:hypothetical protein
MLLQTAFQRSDQARDTVADTLQIITGGSFSLAAPKHPAERETH